MTDNKTTATIDVGTDTETNSNTATITMKDHDGNPLDTVVMSTGSTSTDLSELLYDPESVGGNHSNTITVSRKGDMVIYKAINLANIPLGNLAVQGSTNGWHKVTEVPCVSSEYLSGQIEWFYKHAILHIEPASNTSYAYPVSIAIGTDGSLNLRLERSKDLSKATYTVSGLNFTLVWFVNTKG